MDERLGDILLDINRALKIAASSMESDDFETLFVLKVLEGRGATTDETAIPDGEFDRILKWADNIKFDLNMMALVLMGLVKLSYGDDDDEMLYTLSEKGISEAEKHSLRQQVQRCEDLQSELPTHPNSDS